MPAPSSMTIARKEALDRAWDTVEAADRIAEADPEKARTLATIASAWAGVAQAAATTSVARNFPG